MNIQELQLLASHRGPLKSKHEQECVGVYRGYKNFNLDRGEGGGTSVKFKVKRPFIMLQPNLEPVFAKYVIRNTGLMRY